MRTSYPSNRGNFNPRSPRGGATPVRHTRKALRVFQSTLPTRGSDKSSALKLSCKNYFNPRSPRGGATGLLARRVDMGRHFNPRSPRGGATHKGRLQPRRICISIHAPHEGERRPGCCTRTTQKPFQSTLPTRGSDNLASGELYADDISIHAPHEGERQACVL